MKHEVGGARNALRRRLTQAAEIGNTQIRLELGMLNGGWEEPLMELVNELAEFNQEMMRQILSPAAS